MFTFQNLLVNIFQNQKIYNIFDSTGIFNISNRFGKFGNTKKSNRYCKVIFGIQPEISCEVGFN
jgi:hypothetical protein